MSIAREIVGFAMEAGSSDIHLEEESPIAVRVNSDIKVSPQKLESEDMDQLLLELLGEEKLNEFKYKVNQYKSNMINIKKVRKAEKLLGNIYSGFILSVQTYGFFVEISELNVEGLVHVSTLNNDWYEYRSRQNLLIGRKSKKSYKVGDAIEVKIIKVDILKYQIDLELA